MKNKVNKIFQHFGFNKNIDDMDFLEYIKTLDASTIDVIRFDKHNQTIYIERNVGHHCYPVAISSEMWNVINLERKILWTE